MKLRIEVDLDNAALVDEYGGTMHLPEVERLLRVARNELREMFAGEARTLRDMNGNTVGTVEVVR